MQSTKLGKYLVWHENSDEFYELKKEIFGENCYYVELASETPRIIDAGAHIGLTTLYFKQLYPKAQIVAIEPQSDNFALLQKNVRENQLENVELIQAALAPKAGLITLQEPYGEGIWRSGTGIILGGWRGVQKTKAVKVSAVGILELLDQPVDLLKLDVEGMEYELIRSAKAKLRNVKHLIIEVHPRRDHRQAEIEKILSELGFRFEVDIDTDRLGQGLAQISAVLQ